MDWQTIAVFVVIAAAAAFVVRRLTRNAQGHSDGACDKCGPMEKAKHHPK